MRSVTLEYTSYILLWIHGFTPRWTHHQPEPKPRSGGFWALLDTSKRLFIDTSWKVLEYAKNLCFTEGFVGLQSHGQPNCLNGPSNGYQGYLTFKVPVHPPQLICSTPLSVPL